MIRTVLVFAALGASTLPAAAYCYAAFDTAGSNYVENSTQHLLCLQNELSQTTQQMELEARWKAEVEALTQQQLKLAPYSSLDVND